MCIVDVVLLGLYLAVVLFVVVSSVRAGSPVRAVVAVLFSWCPVVPMVLALEAV